MIRYIFSSDRFFRDSTYTNDTLSYYRNYLLTMCEALSPAMYLMTWSYFMQQNAAVATHTALFAKIWSTIVYEILNAYFWKYSAVTIIKRSPYVLISCFCSHRSEQKVTSSSTVLLQQPSIVAQRRKLFELVYAVSRKYSSNTSSLIRNNKQRHDAENIKYHP